MKPCKLTMKAFGCYVNETVIDFEKFNNGIYLITGDTGAGKTTIFDAIMFALYSDVSGTNSQTIMKVRSDYVDNKLPMHTEVELEFLHQGRKYRITRTIPVVKDRETKLYKLSKVRQANLVELKDGMEIPLVDSDKDTIVNKQVVALLGINRDQFAQIIMLPQGEFKKFLQANSDNKGAILGKLFDNSLYIRFQEILGTACDKLTQERKNDQEAIRIQMENVFIRPNEVSDNVSFAAENENVEENLSALLLSEEKEHKIVEEEIQLLKNNRDACIAKKEQARNDNNNLVNLAKLRQEYGIHISKSQEMQELKAKYNRVHDGVVQLLPIISNLHENRQTIAKTERELKDAQVDISEKEVERKQAEQETINNPLKNERIDKLNVSISEIDRSLPDYKRLMDEQEKQVKAGQTKEKAEKQVELLTEELKNIVGRQKDIQMRLKLLADIDIDLTTAEHTLEAVNTVYQRFLGKKGFIAAKDACLAEQAKIREEEKHLELLIKEQERADIFLKEQKFNFYQSQAFNLAKELQGKMQTVKELICPVCGQITANDERFKQHLAIFDHQSLVTKEEVEKAEIAFENSRQKAETHSNELQNRILTLNNYVKVFSERVLDAVKNLSASFPQSVKAGLEAAFILTDNHLNECQSWVGELLQEAQMNVSRYRAQKNQKTNLERETVELEQKQEQLNNKLNEIKRIQTECEKALEVSGAIVQQLSEKLVYKNRQEAENKMLIIQNERNQLLSEVNTSIANFTKADNALTGAQGRLEVIKKKLTELKEKGEEYSVALEKRLEAYSFADEEAVLEEITVDGQQLDSASPWLTLTQNRLTDYEKETELLKKQIESLTKDTAGKTLVDLQEIEDKITELTGMIDGELASREKNLAGLIDNHAKVLANVKIKRRKLLKSDKAYRILKNLAGIATGDISNQGKIDFDRYIKGEIFREVLRFANIRLDKMTGGTRELVHRIEGDRANAKAGLDLDIYDAETGTRRSDTSLSGGESFMASLSLALGLSDVVKSRIGGMKIESLFIDEGFGTLDDDKLDRAVEVLNDLTEGDCLVGVISHVGKLEESIAQKILVKKTAGKGSYVKSII